MPCSYPSSPQKPLRHGTPDAVLHAKYYIYNSLSLLLALPLFFLRVTGQWRQHLAQSAIMCPWWGIASEKEKMNPREALSFQLTSVNNRTLYFFLPFALAFEGAGLVDTTLVAREVDAEADVPFLTLSSCLF